MIELTHEELTHASEEDVALFNKCIEGLPTREGLNGDGLDYMGVPIPYGSGPYLIKHIKETIELTGCARVLEIGFNLGWGSALWINLIKDEHSKYVCSVDISDKDETLMAANFLEHKYGPRFDFIHCDSKRVWYLLAGRYYDLCFIDGAHDEESVHNDIQLAIDLRIPYILFDDWYPRYGETQKAVALFRELELVKDMNNLRLYKVNYVR
jgi:hypothetical protein